MSTMPMDVTDAGGAVHVEDITDAELRWEFYRAAMAAWAEAAGRAPVPAPRTSCEDTLRRVPR